MQKDYYLILGVNSGASREEIKSAFRRRAMELHPDHSGMESGPFQELQEAYGILNDPDRRRRYDQRADMPVVRRVSPEPFNPTGRKTRVQIVCDISVVDFERFHPSFDEIFDRLWSNFEHMTRLER